MDPRDGQHLTSYEKAIQNTFKTTYGTSYRGVDTYHRSPVYTERNYDSTTIPRGRQYERESYPYHNDNKDVPEEYVTQNPAPWRQIYDYDQDQRPMHDASPRHQENQHIPIEKKSCHACREPEAYSPKNSNQLRCMHKFCDNCIKRLRTTKERFGDITAKFFHCDMCPSSMTAGPTVIRFDPYGRRITKYVQRRLQQKFRMRERVKEQARPPLICDFIVLDEEAERT